LLKCIAFDAITAFRVWDLTWLGRNRVDESAIRHVERQEIEVLLLLARSYDLKIARGPPTVATLVVSITTRATMTETVIVSSELSVCGGGGDRLGARQVAGDRVQVRTDRTGPEPAVEAADQALRVGGIGSGTQAVILPQALRQVDPAAVDGEHLVSQPRVVVKAEVLEQGLVRVLEGTGVEPAAGPAYRST